MKYDYIKYPEDRLYLISPAWAPRVGNLVREIQYYTSKFGNLEAYVYISTIALQIKPDSKPEDIIKTEKFITSPGFLNNRCFREDDINYIKPLIREYKLNQLV